MLRMIFDAANRVFKKALLYFDDPSFLLFMVLDVLSSRFQSAQMGFAIITSSTL